MENLLENNLKTDEKVYFGHNFRLLLNSDHISPGDINDLLKSKGILSPSPNKSSTIPLLSSVLLTPDEFSFLLNNTINREKNPKHRTAEYSLTQKTNDWIEPIQSIDFDLLSDAITAESESIKFLSNPETSFTDTPNQIKIDYKIERSDYSKDILYRSLSFDAEILMQLDNDELKIEIFSVHSCKETELINSKIVSQISAQLKSKGIISNEDPNRILYKHFSNAERILFFKRFSQSINDSLKLGKIIDLLLTVDKETPDFPSDKEISWMNKVIDNLRIDGDDLSKLLLISNEKFYKHFIIKDINLSYDYSIGTNKGCVKVNYCFPNKKDIHESELTHEIFHITYPKRQINDDAKKMIKKSINKHITELIKAQNQAIILNRSNICVIPSLQQQLQL